MKLTTVKLLYVLHTFKCANAYTCEVVKVEKRQWILSFSQFMQLVYSHHFELHHTRAVVTLTHIQVHFTPRRTTRAFGVCLYAHPE